MRFAIAGALGSLAGLVCAWIRFTTGGQNDIAAAFFYWLQVPLLYLHWVIIGALFGTGFAALWRLGKDV